MLRVCHRWVGLVGGSQWVAGTHFIVCTGETVASGPRFWSVSWTLCIILDRLFDFSESFIVFVLVSQNIWDPVIQQSRDLFLIGDGEVQDPGAADLVVWRGLPAPESCVLSQWKVERKACLVLSEAFHRRTLTPWQGRSPLSQSPHLFSGWLLNVAGDASRP